MWGDALLRPRSRLRQISDMPQNVAYNVCLRSFGSHLTTKLSVTSTQCRQPCQSCHCIPRGLPFIYPSFLCKVNCRTGYHESTWNCFVSGFLSFYLLNMAAANDAQRVILLSCITQIRALQAQLLILKLLQLNIIVHWDGDPKTTALSCTSTAHRKT